MSLENPESRAELISVLNGLLNTKFILEGIIFKILFNSEIKLSYPFSSLSNIPLKLLASNILISCLSNCSVLNTLISLNIF